MSMEQVLGEYGSYEKIISAMVRSNLDYACYESRFRCHQTV